MNSIHQHWDQLIHCFERSDIEGSIEEYERFKLGFKTNRSQQEWMGILSGIEERLALHGSMGSETFLNWAQSRDLIEKDLKESGIEKKKWDAQDVVSVLIPNALIKNRVNNARIMVRQLKRFHEEGVKEIPMSAEWDLINRESLSQIKGYEWQKTIGYWGATVASLGSIEGLEWIESLRWRKNQEEREGKEESEWEKLDEWSWLGCMQEALLNEQLEVMKWMINRGIPNRGSKDETSKVGNQYWEEVWSGALKSACYKGGEWARWMMFDWPQQEGKHGVWARQEGWVEKWKKEIKAAKEKRSQEVIEWIKVLSENEQFKAVSKQLSRGIEGKETKSETPRL